MTITETCSCGASITIHDRTTNSWVDTIALWRANHIHDTNRVGDPTPFPDLETK